MNLLHTTFELIVGFAALFIITKILGKTQISQITPFDFISALVLGELLGNAIYDKETTLFNILYTLSLWCILMIIVEFLTQKSIKLRGILEGKPSIVIRNGIIDREELKKNRLDLDQLQSLLRDKEVFSIREVEYALLESDGKVSVLKKDKYNTPTLEDLNIPSKKVYLPISIITDGEVLWDNLRLIGYDEEWLKHQLFKEEITSYSDVFFADYVKDEGLFIVPLDKKK